MGNNVNQPKITIYNVDYENNVSGLLGTNKLKYRHFVRPGQVDNIQTEASKKLITINLFIESNTFDIVVNNDTTIKIYKDRIEYYLYNNLIVEYLKDLITSKN
jgi:hypothetical protein